MNNITIENILNAKNNKEILLIKNAFLNLPRWVDFYHIFNESMKNNKINFQSFASMTIDNSEKYSNVFNDILENIYKLHNGKKISVMSIIHFQNRNNMILTDKDSVILFQSFEKNNNQTVPDNFDYNLLKPTIHSDPVDGFFIQCEGKTEWIEYGVTCFGHSRIKKYTVNPGDMLYIPSGLQHSVESLCPRASVSISFTDK